MTDTPFIELIRHICKRPAMFTGGSVKETIAFIDGYRSGTRTPISGRVFDQFVCARNAFPHNYAWGYVITACSKDEENAMQMIEATISEFLLLKEKMTDEQLIQYVNHRLPEETEAEKIFRQFNTALLSGDQALIRPLIEEHRDADILWVASYPGDVSNQLSQISAGHRVKSIPLSADGKKVRIIAFGWPFPIEMNMVNGHWKINATDIIKLRMKNK